MKKNTALASLVIILLAAFFLYEYKLLDFPYYGDEVDGGDITAKILQGQIAPFYPEGDGHEALYNFTMAPFFMVLGESVIASRWPSVAWTTVTVALMYVYGQRLFKSRRVGVMAAGLTASLVWTALYAHLSLRVVTLSAVMIPALLGLVLVLRALTDRGALQAGVVGGLFAGLSAYSYTSGRGLPAIVAAFLIYVAIMQRDLLFKRWRAFLVYLILTGLVSVWLYAYLRAHPEFDQRIRDMAQLSWFFRGDWSGFPQALLQTLGMFTVRGEPNWVNNISERPVFVGPEGILFYWGVLLCLLRLRQPEYGLQLIVLVPNMALSIITEHPPSWGRSMGMLPALIVITVLPVEWAWSKLERIRERGVPNRWLGFLRGRAMLPTYALLVAILGVSIYTRTAFDIFEVWMNAPGVYWMSLAFYDETAKYVNRSPDSTPLDFSMDWYVPWRRTNVKRAVQRQDVPLRWTINNALVFPDNPKGLRVAFQILAEPARALQQAFFGAAPPIYIDSRTDPTGQHPLRIYAIPRERLDEHLSRARQNPVTLSGGTTPPEEPVQVGDSLQFLGYEIINPTAHPGDDLDVLTYWRVLHRPPDLAIFLHLLDTTNKVVAQYDGFDVVRDDLKPGDTIVQLHALKLPFDLSNQDYRFELGAYAREDLQRLPLNTGSDHVLLQTWSPASRP